MSRLNGTFLILMFLLVALVNNYTLSVLGSFQVSSGQSLLGRGIICTILSIFGGLLSKEELIPTHLKVQIARFFFSGFGLWATVASYQYARASEIALVSRLDIPIIILAGFLVSLRTSSKQKMSSILLIGCIGFSIYVFSNEKTTAMGLGLAAVGAFILSLSYVLLSRTARNESAAIVTLTPGLACIVFGSLIQIKNPQTLNLNPVTFFLTSLSGLAMYTTYRMVRQLYRRYSFLKAQVGYILIPIISIPIDIVGFNKQFNINEYIVFFLISLFAISICFLNGKDELSNGGFENECTNN